MVINSYAFAIDETFQKAKGKYIDIGKYVFIPKMGLWTIKYKGGKFKLEGCEHGLKMLDDVEYDVNSSNRLLKGYKEVRLEEEEVMKELDCHGKGKKKGILSLLELILQKAYHQN